LLAPHALARSLAAELVGTFALVFAGAGAIVVDAKTQALGHVGIAITFGLVIMAVTFFLMFVIMSVATDTRAVGEAAALAVGGTVGLDAMFGGPISGASMNPARSLGPALVGGELHALWLYLVAPLVGAALGALAYQFVRGAPV
jgi:glycerol uptake facilitator-like aquaporin